MWRYMAFMICLHNSLVNDLSIRLRVKEGFLNLFSILISLYLLFLSHYFLEFLFIKRHQDDNESEQVQECPMECMNKAGRKIDWCEKTYTLLKHCVSQQSISWCIGYSSSDILRYRILAVHFVFASS